MDPGVLLKDPGALLKDPGVLYKDPDVLLRDLEILLKDPGVHLPLFCFFHGSAGQRHWPPNPPKYFGTHADCGGHVQHCSGYLKAIGLNVFGPVLLGFRPEIDPKTP